MGPVRCTFCGCDRLGSPEEPPGVGSPIICGQCGALMVLDVKIAGGVGPDVEWEPFVRRCGNTERQQLSARADVARYRAAFQADQITARMRVPKRKVKDVGAGGPTRIHDGQQIRMRLVGPDHPDRPR